MTIRLHLHQDDFDSLTAEDVRAYCAAAPEYVAELDDFDYTPLMGACSKGKTEIARVLLDAGADPNYVAPDGETPLKSAVDSQPLDPALFDLLLGAGADPNTGFEPALHIAVARGRQDVVAYLIEHGADPNSEDGDGEPPLMWAGRSGGRPDILMMRLLIHLGADITRRDGFGRTVEDWIGPAAMREALRPYEGL